MTPAQVNRLEAAAAVVGSLLSEDHAPGAIMSILVRKHGARLKKQAWTNTFRFGGLATSCTSSADKGLLDNWRRLATLRLMAARQGGAGAE